MSISAIFLALHFGSWIWSLDHTSLVHSLLFVTSHPLVVVALMPLIGTSVRRGHVLGAVIGFIGASIALLEVESNSQVTLIGDLQLSLVPLLLSGLILEGTSGLLEAPRYSFAFPVTLLAGLILTVGSVSIEGTA